MDTAFADSQIKTPQDWIGAFAAALMQLDTGLCMEDAIHCAVQSYHDACDAAPGSAAECFAMTHFSEDLDSWS